MTTSEAALSLFVSVTREAELEVECTHDLVMSAFDHLSSCSCGPVRVGDFSDGG